MTTRTASITRADSRLGPIAVVMLAGVLLFSVTSFSQAAAMHDTAHDQRHSMSFPCH